MRCGQCVEFRPQEENPRFTFGPWTLFPSKRAYFKKRSRRERPEVDRNF